MAALLAAVLLPSAMLGGALDSAAQQEQVDRWASNAKGFFAGAVLLHVILGATIIKHAIGARNLDSAVATAAPTASGRCRWHSDRLKLRLLMDGCSHSRSGPAVLHVLFIYLAVLRACGP